MILICFRLLWGIFGTSNCICRQQTVHRDSNLLYSAALRGNDILWRFLDQAILHLFRQLHVSENQILSFEALFLQFLLSLSIQKGEVIQNLGKFKIWDLSWHQYAVSTKSSLFVSFSAGFCGISIPILQNMSYKWIWLLYCLNNAIFCGGRGIFLFLGGRAFSWWPPCRLGFNHNLSAKSCLILDRKCISVLNGTYRLDSGQLFQFKSWKNRYMTCMMLAYVMGWIELLPLLHINYCKSALWVIFGHFVHKL